MIDIKVGPSNYPPKLEVGKKINDEQYLFRLVRYWLGEKIASVGNYRTKFI